MLVSLVAPEDRTNDYKTKIKKEYAIRYMWKKCGKSEKKMILSHWKKLYSYWLCFV